MNKERKIDSLKNILLKLQKKGKKIVFTNGCFDLIHPGHIKILKLAKKSGDVLVVALNSDRSIKMIKKNNRPILGQKARIQILSAIQYVDYLLVFNQKTPYQAINKLRPDILVKGGDWPKDKIVGRNLVKKVIQVKLASNYSTTNIIKKIKKSG